MQRMAGSLLLNLYLHICHEADEFLMLWVSKATSANPAWIMYLHGHLPKILAHPYSDERGEDLEDDMVWVLPPRLVLWTQVTLAH